VAESFSILSLPALDLDPNFQTPALVSFHWNYHIKTCSKTSFSVPSISMDHAFHADLCVCLLLQYLIQSCARGGRRIVEDMCYEIRRAETCVD
jgi:hypothetical protein